MKTEEDEAFEELERRQGGGFKAKQAMAADKLQGPVKLWLWKNFVDGKPEYWAFDNPFPIFMDNNDPQTLGEPCGYAVFKPSRTGRADVSDEQVLQDIQKALEQPAPKREWVGLTDEEIDAIYWQHENHFGEYKVSIWPYERAIEAKLKENNGT